MEQDQQQLQKGEQEKVQILSSEEEEGNGDSQQQTVGVVPVDAAAADRGKSQLVSLGCVATATPLLICWGDE